MQGTVGSAGLEDVAVVEHGAVITEGQILHGHNEVARQDAGFVSRGAGLDGEDPEAIVTIAHEGFAVDANPVDIVASEELIKHRKSLL